MFPLAFPLGVLRERAAEGDWVLDPFCGRGTTNYAARVLGLPSIGIDSSPVAVAIAQAKLVTTTPLMIVAAAERMLSSAGRAQDPPDGDFWQLAYTPDVLTALCRLRAGLLRDCRSAARTALRAIVLGALHGPRTKGRPSHFSNQCPRTYAPKPRYAVSFWGKRGLRPPEVDVIELIRARAERYYADQPGGTGTVYLADSRAAATFASASDAQPRWIITSPPYYGMRTYLPDQWLRNWFLGGDSRVDYSSAGQLGHPSPAAYADQLRAVWKNVASVASPDAQLIVRFGGIADRKADPLSIVKSSIKESGWKIATVKPAGSAASGRRQSLHFARTSTAARDEYDVWARRA
jgi:DNA methylase